MFLSLAQLRLRIKQRTTVLATFSVISGVGRRGSLLQQNGQKFALFRRERCFVP